jgi:hypothetical protein
MVIPGDDWVFRDVIWQCQRILSKLTYQQSQAVCRAFGWAYSTYKARCSMYRPAQLWEALLIVDWALRGKPIVRKRHKCNITWDEYREKIAEPRKELAEQRQRGWGQV